MYQTTTMRITNYNEYFSLLSPIEKKYAPVNLFHRGHFHFMTDYVKVSVVGSRKVSSEGAISASIISQVLTELNYVVVSGLAEGVDTIAHSEAIKSGGKTIAVLGTPLNKVTPKANEQLYSEICKNHLAVSQFQENSIVGKANFPMRNRTMALISDATIIVEASEISGTRHQGWEALRLGRPLYLLEDLFKRNLTWPQKMIDYGAIRIHLSEIKDSLSLISQLTLVNEFSF